MDNNLEVKNLCKKYDGFELKNINIELPKGMILGLIGENGAGKTTTIKSILNLIKSNSGEIKIFGLNVRENEKKVKEDIGVVLDDSFFSEYLNPTDINKIMKNIYKNWDEKLYFKYLENFKLPKNKISKEFSSGMKMKLKITVALSHHPKLLILDEPTSGLDPVARSEILDIFQDFIQFEKIDKNDYVKFKVNKYEYDVLVEDKIKFKRKYDFQIIDKPTLDEIMLIYIKGEK